MCLNLQKAHQETVYVDCKIILKLLLRAVFDEVKCAHVIESSKQ
jgi:hypothetical protein